MAKFDFRTIGNFDEIVGALDRAILDSALTMRLVEESLIVCRGARVSVRVYDQYFMRNSSRAALTLTVVEADGEVAISAIGSGGGTGAIFNFSYGAESKMVGVVEDAVRRMGL